MIPPKRFDSFPPDAGGVLRRSRHVLISLKNIARVWINRVRLPILFLVLS